MKSVQNPERFATNSFLSLQDWFAPARACREASPFYVLAGSYRQVGLAGYLQNRLWWDIPFKVHAHKALFCFSPCGSLLLLSIPKQCIGSACALPDGSHAPHGHRRVRFGGFVAHIPLPTLWACGGWLFYLRHLGHNCLFAIFRSSVRILATLLNRFLKQPYLRYI